MGSGKTTVARRFAARGVDIIDADIAARAVVKPGTAALSAIHKHFGNQVMSPDGTLNRAALRTIIFRNLTEKQWLESLLHPLIHQAMVAQLDKTRGIYAMIVSPLLVEAKQQDLCDRILVVDAPEEQQVARIQQRDHSSLQDIQYIIASQMGRQQRLNQADDIIDNSGDLSCLEPRIKQLHEQYVRTCLVKG